MRDDELTLLRSEQRDRERYRITALDGRNRLIGTHQVSVRNRIRDVSQRGGRSQRLSSWGSRQSRW